MKYIAAIVLTGGLGLLIGYISGYFTPKKTSGTKKTRLIFNSRPCQCSPLVIVHMDRKKVL